MQNDFYVKRMCVCACVFVFGLFSSGFSVFIVPLLHCEGSNQNQTKLRTAKKVILNVLYSDTHRLMG